VSCVCDVLFCLFRCAVLRYSKHLQLQTYLSIPAAQQMPICLLGDVVLAVLGPSPQLAQVLASRIGSRWECLDFTCNIGLHPILVAQL
jgi:hypothetical protein